MNTLRAGSFPGTTPEYSVLRVGRSEERKTVYHVGALPTSIIAQLTPKRELLYTYPMAKARGI